MFVKKHYICIEFKITKMETTKIKKEKRTSGLQKEKQQTQEPKRLSKAGIWRREHPNGIGKILDYSIFDR